jgi:SPP1 gp7 family putative phage head morphogenesis protein
MPFERAVRIFQSKKVMPRATFDKLSARAKQRAFTVANVVSDDALRVIQSELASQIGLGGSLASFADKIGERMKTAGFLASPETTSTGATILRASHVETVYRTNVLGAYNAGRAEQMRQPAVLARRPVWMIRSVQDGRTRDTHKAVNGVKLLASDPFWRTAYPPFGYNCRCRVISLGPGSMDEVVSGSTISGLPDEDFSSGLGSLLEPDPF